MIISASYKTDIPAFYGEWFKNRIEAGFCKMVNPYNRKQISKVSLQRQDVDGFVFWTKNLGPFMSVLDEVHQRQYPFVVQFTINGYPRELETRVIDAKQSVDKFRVAYEKYGPDAMIWRYDTIIFTNNTDADFHKRNFARLASELRCYTSEVVVSFVQLYRKTRTNMERAAQQHGFDWYDPPPETKRALLGDLLDIARENRLTLSICTQPELMVPGVNEARCIDAERLMRVGARPSKAAKKGMRPNCGCYASRDIGDYDTCPHGCIYCYAVRNRELAIQRYQEHDPFSEFLFAPENAPMVEADEGSRPMSRQPPLFRDHVDGG